MTHALRAVQSQPEPEPGPLSLLGDMVRAWRQASAALSALAHTPNPSDPAEVSARHDAASAAQTILIETEDGLRRAGYHDILGALHEEAGAHRVVSTTAGMARRAATHTNELVQLRDAIDRTPDPARDEHGDWRTCELHSGAITQDCACSSVQGLGDVDAAMAELWQQTTAGRQGEQVPDVQLPMYRRAARRIVAVYLGVEVPR
jgi:hypothetical protein